MLTKNHCASQILLLSERLDWTFAGTVSTECRIWWVSGLHIVRYLSSCGTLPQHRFICLTVAIIDLSLSLFCGMVYQEPVWNQHQPTGEIVTLMGGTLPCCISFIMWLIFSRTYFLYYSCSELTFDSVVYALFSDSIIRLNKGDEHKRTSTPERFVVSWGTYKSKAHSFSSLLLIWRQQDAVEVWAHPTGDWRNAIWKLSHMCMRLTLQYSRDFFQSIKKISPAFLKACKSKALGKPETFNVDVYK